MKGTAYLISVWFFVWGIHLCDGAGQKRMFTVLTIILKYSLTVFACILPRFTHGGQGTTCRSQFPPATMWDLEINLRLSGSADSTFSY